MRFISDRNVAANEIKMTWNVQNNSQIMPHGLIRIPLNYVEIMVSRRINSSQDFLGPEIQNIKKQEFHQFKW